MDVGLLWQGLELMIAGMATVFVFLSLLVAATALMSLAVRRLAPAAALEVAPVTAEEVAAIAVAVHRHRSGRAGTRGGRA